MSSIKEQGDLLKTLPHQATRSGILTKFFFFKKKSVVVRSFTADGNLLQPTGCVNRTPSHVTFSRVFSALVTVSHMTLAQGVLRTSSHVSCAHVVVLILFDSPFCTLHRLSHLPPHSPDLHLHYHLPCGSVRREVPCALSRMRSLTLLSTTPLSLWRSLVRGACRDCAANQRRTERSLANLCETQ